MLSPTSRASRSHRRRPIRSMCTPVSASAARRPRRAGARSRAPRRPGRRCARARAARAARCRGSRGSAHGARRTRSRRSRRTRRGMERKQRRGDVDDRAGLEGNLCGHEERRSGSATVSAPTTPSGRCQRTSGGSIASSARTEQVDTTAARIGAAARASAVQIAFAWTSAPCHQLVAAEGSSGRRGASGPCRRRRRSCPQLRVGHLAVQDVRERDGGDRAGGPRWSIQARPSREPSGSACGGRARGGRHGDSRPPTSRGKLAMAPLVSLRRSDAAARESIPRRFSSPPSTRVWPWPSLSLVARMAPPASPRAS